MKTKKTSATSLQTRAQAFLARPVPNSIDYVPNSIAEQFIRAFAKTGSLPGDDETSELLELTAMESSAVTDSQTDPAAAEYFRESSALLEGILAERG